MSGSVSESSDLARDLTRGLSLPASWYTDAKVVEQERDRIFRRSWQYVGRMEQVSHVGDFFTATVGDIPIIVVRSEKALNAFVNVCRHRRHEVLRGAGRVKSLQCPYHAWRYDLDGRLRAAPRSERETGFDRKDYPLLSLLVDTWGPFTFVTADLTAPPLTTILGDLPRLIAESGLVLDELRLRQREDWVADANWKVMIENFLECYHCPVQHPSFSTVVDVDEHTYSLRASQWFSSQVAPVRRAALEGRGRKPAYDVRGAVTQAQYHFLWPNFTVSINPGHPNLSVDVWIPDGPGRTRGFSEHWFGPDVPEQFVHEVIEFNKLVGAEDDRLTSSVQRGLHAGRPAQGRFLVKSEHLVVHFQQLILDALG